MVLRVEVEVIVVHVIVEMMVDDVFDVVPVQLVRVLHMIHHIVPVIMNVHLMALGNGNMV